MREEEKTSFYTTDRTIFRPSSKWSFVVK
jgi:hypothetical protein